MQDPIQLHSCRHLPNPNSQPKEILITRIASAFGPRAQESSPRHLGKSFGKLYAGPSGGAKGTHRENSNLVGYEK